MIGQLQRSIFSEQGILRPGSSLPSNASCRPVAHRMPSVKCFAGQTGRDLLPWMTYFGSPLLWVHLHEQTWVNFYERRGMDAIQAEASPAEYARLVALAFIRRALPEDSCMNAD